MRIAIIGAGATGLAAAWELQKKGHTITIYEKEALPGGLARGFRSDAWQDSVECFYHHWFKSDQSMLALTEELGLRDSVIFRKPKSVMFHKGKFYPFDTILAALAYPGLGFGFNKIRFGLVGLYLRMTRSWKALEQVTAENWMMRFAGESVYRSMWEPMMIGKFGEKYASQVNMAWLWARIHSRTPELGTFKGGFQAFFDRFCEILRSKEVRFCFDTPVTAIERKHDGEITVISADGSMVDFERVIVTASPGAFVKMTTDLPESYRNQLLQLKSMGAVVMIIALKHALSPEGYYWYNLPKTEGYPCLALVEHTNFVPKERFGGQTIIYAGDYLETDHEHFSLPKEQLLQKMLPALKKINPAFQDDWVIDSWKFTESYAQPIPFVGQSTLIPDLKTPVDGIYLATMSQVYPWDRGLNYAFRLGKDVSRLIL